MLSLAASSAAAALHAALGALVLFVCYIGLSPALVAKRGGATGATCRLQLFLLLLLVTPQALATEPSPPEPLPLPVLSLSEESPTVKCGATSSAALPADQVEPGEPKPDSLALQSLSDAVLAQTEANRDTAATLKVVGALVEESTEIQPLTIPIELARSNSQALMVAFRRKRGRPSVAQE